VYILSGNPDQTRLLQTRFNDPFFELKVAQIDVPDDLPLGGLSRSKAAEWYRFNWVLKDFESSVYSHVLVVKDNIVGNSDASTYADIIDATINATDFHVCFCARFWDNCEVHTDKKSIANRTTMIAKTHGVSGTHALLVSRKGMKMFMGKEPMNNGKMFDLQHTMGEQLKIEIMNENLDAIVIVPSLFSFDITKAKTVDDYKKLAECQIPSQNEKISTVIEPSSAPNASVKIIPSTNESMSWVLWFLVAIFILLVCYISIAGLRQYIKSSNENKAEVDVVMQAVDE
jgi:hypothetical protein